MVDLLSAGWGVLWPLANGDGHAHFELPPLHPILVHFTVALVPLSLASDLLARFFRRESLSAAGFWTLAYASAVTPLTAVAGWLWRSQKGDMGHGEMVIHQWLGTGLALVIAGLALWRSRAHLESRKPGVAYLVVASLVVGAVVVQAGLGGRMTFGAHAPSAVTAASGGAEAGEGAAGHGGAHGGAAQGGAAQGGAAHSGAAHGTAPQGTGAAPSPGEGDFADPGLARPDGDSASTATPTAGKAEGSQGGGGHGGH